MTTKTKPCPANMGASGRKFWSEVLKTYELRPDELRLLEDAAREMDLIDRLEKAAREAPLMISGSMGQEVVNPLVQEIRQHRTALRGLLARLDLPDSNADPQAEAGRRSSAARSLAQARWKRGA